MSSSIPEKYVERFKSLRPGRKMIVMAYFEKRRNADGESIIPKVAKELGYSVNKENNSNSFILKVIKEFLT